MDFDMAGIFMIYGNPDLKPETSHNFQLSAEYTRRLLTFSIGTFCNLVSDRITTGWSQALKGQVYTNIDKVAISAWMQTCHGGQPADSAHDSHICSRMNR